MLFPLDWLVESIPLTPKGMTTRVELGTGKAKTNTGTRQLTNMTPMTAFRLMSLGSVFTDNLDTI